MISSNHSRAHRDSPKRSHSLMLAAMAVSFLFAANPLRADEVTKWNEVGTTASLDSGLCGPAGIPLFESRVDVPNSERLREVDGSCRGERGRRGGVSPACA